MTSSQAKRFLAARGCSFEPGKGGHLMVRRGHLKTVLPMHGSGKELGKGFVEQNPQGPRPQGAMTMLRYPVRLSRDSNGTLMVTSPDFPEVSTFGTGPDDALIHAADAIATAIQGRITDRQEVPRPSEPRRGHRMACLSALTWAKLELYRAMLETGTRKADLARRLKVHSPQIDRLLDLDHDSRLDQIENAARAMGRELRIEMRPVAA